MWLILFNGCIEAEGSLPAVETGFFRQPVSKRLSEKTCSEAGWLERKPSG